MTTAITDAFTASTATALRAMPQRPAGADPTITAQFLAGGMLTVIGHWLAEPRTRYSRDSLVEAMLGCLPFWILETKHDPHRSSPDSE